MRIAAPAAGGGASWGPLREALDRPGRDGWSGGARKGIDGHAPAGYDPASYTDPFGLAPCPPDCGVADAADLAAGLTPGVSTLHDAVTLITGTNHLTGEEVGFGGRFIAFAGLASPLSGGEIRASSKLVTGAARALAGRIGRNSVSVPIEGGFKRVDLVGKAHKGVPTPHVHMYKLHTNPATGASRYKKDFAGPASRLDVIEAAREAGQVK